MFSYSGRVKSPKWRWQRKRADLRHFEIFRHGPITIYTRLPAGGTYYPICTFPASSECLIGISDAFSAFVYGSPPSCPRAHCTPNKSVPTLRYTRRHGPRYTGPCPKALTECSPLDFRRSSIDIMWTSPLPPHPPLKKREIRQRKKRQWRPWLYYYYYCYNYYCTFIMRSSTPWALISYPLS